jgi:hypothetical protein
MDAPLPDDFDPYGGKMNEPNWYDIGLTALIAIGAWLFKRHVSRVDQIEEDYVTREELDKTITQLRDEREDMREDGLRMHQENSKSLQYIRERVDSLVDRSR